MSRRRLGCDSEDPGATWNASTNSIQGSCAPGVCADGQYHASSPRIVPVPLFDIDAFFAGSPNGKTSVTITNIMGFFIEGMGGPGNKDVIGRLVAIPGLTKASEHRRRNGLVPAESAVGTVSDTQMATHLVPEVLVVDPLDRELEQLLGACGMRATRGSAAELTALAHPAAQQPHVVVVDTRGARAIPPSMAAVKRQHPATGVPRRRRPSRTRRSCSKRCGPARPSSCTSRSRRPRSSRRSRASSRIAPSPAADGEVFAFVGAKGGVGTTTTAVNVATALAKVAPSQTLFADLHVAHGDAALLFGAEPRFSIVDALENTHRFDEAFFRGLVTPTKARRDAPGLVRSCARSARRHASSSGRSSSSRRSSIAT